MSVRLTAAFAASILAIINWLVIPDPPSDRIAAEVGSSVPLLAESTTTSAAPLVAEVSTSAVRGTQVQVESTTTIPEPRAEWDGVIPEYYGAGSGCSRAHATLLAWAMWDAGADDVSVLWMLGVVSRESTCDSSAHNGNRNTGDDSWGLCQINALAGHFDADGIVAEFDRYRFAADFAYNAAACAKLWSVCGRGPWTSGNYYCTTPEELR